jgi:hypothetical protein
LGKVEQKPPVPLLRKVEQNLIGFLIDFLLGFFAPLFSKKWKKLNLKTISYLNVL